MDSQVPWLASALRSARQARGLSRDELAEQVGVSLKSIQRYEEGRQTPRVDTLHRLSAVLGVPVGKLISTEDPAIEDLLKTIIERLDELSAEVREIRSSLVTR